MEKFGYNNHFSRGSPTKIFFLFYIMIYVKLLLSEYNLQEVFLITNIFFFFYKMYKMRNTSHFSLVFVKILYFVVKVIVTVFDIE